MLLLWEVDDLTGFTLANCGRRELSKTVERKKGLGRTQ